MARERSPSSDGEPSLWIFGYGSLMWRPGFPFLDKTRARLAGYHRGFYVYSTHHRGSALRPGLVLGLDRGGVCDGIAYRVAPAEAAATLAYLREREQVTGVYNELRRSIHLTDRGEDVVATTFVVERAHIQYAGRISLARQARIIRGAEGQSGANLDYLVNTLAHMHEVGIRDTGLERLLVLLSPYLASGKSEAGRSSRTAAAHRAARALPAPVRPMDEMSRHRFAHRRGISRWHEV